MKEFPGPLGFISSRAIIFGGPLVQEDQQFSALIEGLNKYTKGKAIYSQFRNLWEVGKQDLMDERGFYYEEHLDILVDLTKTEEELWKDVHSKRRNEIRRAGKEGTTFALIEDDHLISESYDILHEVYQRAKLPLPSREFFRQAFKVLGPKKMIRCFGAFNQGKLIGTLYAFSYKDMLYDWYAGSYRAHYKQYPNDLIPWEIFKWGKENGYKVWDFGGAGKPNVPYGVRDYKKKFGGELVCFGRFERINHPAVFQLAKRGFEVWQKVKFKK